MLREAAEGIGMGDYTRSLVGIRDWRGRLEMPERAATRAGFVPSNHAGLKSAITTRSSMGRVVSLVIIGFLAAPAEVLHGNVARMGGAKTRK